MSDRGETSQASRGKNEPTVCRSHWPGRMLWRRQRGGNCGSRSRFGRNFIRLRVSGKCSRGVRLADKDACGGVEGRTRPVRLAPAVAVDPALAHNAAPGRPTGAAVRVHHRIAPLDSAKGVRLAPSPQSYLRYHSPHRRRDSGDGRRV